MNVMKLMVVALAGWINPQQGRMVDYLREEMVIGAPFLGQLEC